MNYKEIVEDLVNKGSDNIKKKTVVLNDNKPILEKEDFNVIEGNPRYWGTDKYGRITGAIALLSKNTIPIITEKELEYPRPYGWNENLEKVKGVFESCHIIAYNLSAQNTTKENLFIGTNDLNTSIMKQIENEVNNYIQNNYYKVLYKVTVKYKGKDQIPLGILIEAQAIDDEFSICSFCYNIEKYFKFNYSDGSIIYDHRYLEKEKTTLKNDKNKIIEKTNKKETKKAKTENKNIEVKRDYYINIKTKECHYSKECEKLKDVEAKYIQGTRTTESVILENEFKMCNKCNTDKD